MDNDKKDKIKNENAHFVLLPDYFPALNKDLTLNSIIQKNKTNLDSLIELNNSCNGTFIGGMIAREIDENTFYCSIPIIQNGSVIAWYDKNLLTDNENFIFKTNKNTERIFIVNQIRFAILNGREIYDYSLIKSILDEEISLIFHIDNLIEEDLKPYQEEINHFQDLSMSEKIYIIRVCGFGKVNSKKCLSRSLFATPKGIQWKVAESESETEIIKTLQFQLI